MNHIGTLPLETERLILRKFRIEDSKQMFENWASSSTVTKYLTWEPHPSELATRELLSFWMREYEKNDFYIWAIVLKENNQNIGVISVVGTEENISSVRIGYCLGDVYWDHGYMTEALVGIIKFFFDEVGVNRVESCHSVLNPASGRVMEKAGLIKEGIKREADLSNAGLSDLVIYGLVREDYEAQ